MPQPRSTAGWPEHLQRCNGMQLVLLLQILWCWQQRTNGCCGWLPAGLDNKVHLFLAKSRKDALITTGNNYFFFSGAFCNLEWIQPTSAPLSRGPLSAMRLCIAFSLERGVFAVAHARSCEYKAQLPFLIRIIKALIENIQLVSLHFL